MKSTSRKEGAWVSIDRDEAKAVGQHFILYDGGIVLKVYLFNGYSWYFCYDDPPEGVCQWSINTGHFYHKLFVSEGGNFLSKDINTVPPPLTTHYSEILFELFEIERIVNTEALVNTVVLRCGGLSR